MGSIRQSEDYHIVIPKFYTDQECNSICELISEHSDDLIREHSPDSSIWADSNGYTGLTALHSTFNWIPLIEDKLGINLVQRIMEQIDTRDVDDVFIKSWCNLWDKGEGIEPHRHAALDMEQIGQYEWTTTEEHKPYEADCRHYFISGNIFLSDNDHREYGTYYQGKGWVENIRGDLHLFSPLIVHSVDSNTRQEPRMSQAFDIHLDGHFTNTSLEDKEVYQHVEGLRNFIHIEVSRD